MFRRTKAAAVEGIDTAVTVVGRECRVEGRMAAAGDLIVAGEVLGEVAAQGRVTLLEGGVIHGSLQASQGRIEGTLEGPVAVAGALELGPTARVEGDVIADSLGIEEGAVLLGSVRVSGTPSRVTRARAESSAAAGATEPEPAEITG